MTFVQSGNNDCIYSFKGMVNHVANDFINFINIYNNKAYQTQELEYYIYTIGFTLCNQSVLVKILKHEKIIIETEINITNKLKADDLIECIKHKIEDIIFNYNSLLNELD
jgi:hypothetical protein